jgi:hypothetical protein
VGRGDGVVIAAGLVSIVGRGLLRDGGGHQESEWLMNVAHSGWEFQPYYLRKHHMKYMLALYRVSPC